VNFHKYFKNTKCHFLFCVLHWKKKSRVCLESVLSNVCPAINFRYISIQSLTCLVKMVFSP
jgi:hypothetical protein